MRSIFLIWTFLYFSFSVYSQDGKIINFLLVGQEFAETTLSKYNKPLAEGLIYGMTGGWYSMATVKKPWKFDIALISNGTFVPNEKREFKLDISNIENLEIIGGGNTVNIPTILGRTKSNVSLLATLDDRQFEFEVPTGIGLAEVNLLPSAFLQMRMGVFKATEINVRYFPKIRISDHSIGLLGIGFQHEFSQWIEAMMTSKITLSAFVGFSELSMKHKFIADGSVIGLNELFESNIKAWNFAVISSTNYPIYNVFAGLGYVTGTSRTNLKGTYTIETSLRTITFHDPLAIGNNTSGIKLNIGGKARLGKRVSAQLDYTLQGYNNISLGIIYTN